MTLSLAFSIFALAVSCLCVGFNLGCLVTTRLYRRNVR